MNYHFFHVFVSCTSLHTHIPGISPPFFFLLYVFFFHVGLSISKQWMMQKYCGMQRHQTNLLRWGSWSGHGSINICITSIYGQIGRWSSLITFDPSELNCGCRATSVRVCTFRGRKSNVITIDADRSLRCSLCMLNNRETQQIVEACAERLFVWLLIVWEFNPWHCLSHPLILLSFLSSQCGAPLSGWWVTDKHNHAVSPPSDVEERGEQCKHGEEEGGIRRWK